MRTKKYTREEILKRQSDYQKEYNRLRATGSKYGLNIEYIGTSVLIDNIKYEITIDMNREFVIHLLKNGYGFMFLSISKTYTILREEFENGKKSL